MSLEGYTLHSKPRRGYDLLCSRFIAGHFADSSSSVTASRFDTDFDHGVNGETSDQDADQDADNSAEDSDEDGDDEDVDEEDYGEIAGPIIKLKANEDEKDMGKAISFMRWVNASTLSYDNSKVLAVNPNEQMVDHDEGPGEGASGDENDEAAELAYALWLSADNEKGETAGPRDKGKDREKATIDTALDEPISHIPEESEEEEDYGTQIQRAIKLSMMGRSTGDHMAGPSGECNGNGQVIIDRTQEFYDPENGEDLKRALELSKKEW